MKKLLIITLGFVLMGSAIIFLPEASRDAYHNHLTEQANQNRSHRRFSGGMLPLVSQEKNTYQHRSGRPSIRNLRYPVNTKRYLYSQQKTASKTATKTVSKSIRLKAPRHLFSSSNKKFVTGTFAHIGNNWGEYNTGEYTFSLPEGVELKQTQSTLSFKAPKSVSVVITKISEKNVCTGGNFFSCARGIMSTENRKKERLIGRSNETVIERKSGYSNNFADSEAQSEYHLKTGIFFSTKGEEFVTQKVVRGMDGDLFLLDISSPKSSASYTIPFARNIFDSFHVVTK